MTFIPSPQTVKVALNGHLAGQECITVFHFHSPVAVTEALMDSLAADLTTYLAANWGGIMPNNYTLSDFTITDLSNSSAPSKNYSISTITGSHAVGSTPTTNSAALVVTKRTASRGRAYRGRTYVPIVSGAQDSPLDVSIGFLGNVLSAFAPLLTSANFHNFVLSVLSLFLNKVARSSGVATPVTNFSGDTHIDSQRRRLAGRGK